MKQPKAQFFSGMDICNLLGFHCYLYLTSEIKRKESLEKAPRLLKDLDLEVTHITFAHIPLQTNFMLILICVVGWEV